MRAKYFILLVGLLVTTSGSEAEGTKRNAVFRYAKFTYSISNKGYTISMDHYMEWYADNSMLMMRKTAADSVQRFMSGHMGDKGIERFKNVVNCLPHLKENNIPDSFNPDARYYYYVSYCRPGQPLIRVLFKQDYTVPVLQGIAAADRLESVMDIVLGSDSDNDLLPFSIGETENDIRSILAIRQNNK